MIIEISHIPLLLKCSQSTRLATNSKISTHPQPFIFKLLYLIIFHVHVVIGSCSLACSISFSHVFSSLIIHHPFMGKSIYSITVLVTLLSLTYLGYHECTLLCVRSTLWRLHYYQNIFPTPSVHLDPFSRIVHNWKNKPKRLHPLHVDSHLFGSNLSYDYEASRIPSSHLPSHQNFEKQIQSPN